MLHHHHGATLGIRFISDHIERLSIAIHEVITSDERQEAIPREGNAIAEKCRPHLRDKADVRLEIIPLFVITQDKVHTHWGTE